MSLMNRNLVAVTTISRNKGMALLDVVLAIVIFAVGMLALASLQSNLTRSSVDTNSKTVALNIAESILEEIRTFERLDTDPDGLIFAFADIDDGHVTRTVPRGAYTYTVTGTVLGYEYSDEGVSLSEGVSAVAGEIYDFKGIELTVSWNANPEFHVDEDTTITADGMNTGAVQIHGIVPSITTKANAVVAAATDEDGGVLVNYTPGARPDIIQLDLGDNKFKESTTPLPDIVKSDGSTQTWFDVITYNSSNVFTRREEFLVVTCECELQAPGGTGGFLPTLWTGREYVTGAQFSDGQTVERDRLFPKPYGVSTSTVSGLDYCDTCCRDHHDGTGFDSLDEVYDPARLENPDTALTEAGSVGNHKHYSRSKKGDLTVAGPGDTYVEACRMVRKDGFMRVAQDFRQEGFYAFPEGYLETLDGSDEYADFVISTVSDFYLSIDGELAGPDELSPPIVFPGSSADPTSLPFPGLGGLENQQMRSRAIYIDHMSAEADWLVECLYTNRNATEPGAECEADGLNNYLEAYPFFEIQTTFLSWWNSNKPMVVKVTNEVAQTSNTHSRGKASLEDSSSNDDIQVKTDMHRGNLGLSVTDPISPRDDPESVQSATVVPHRDYTVFVDVYGDGSTEGPSPDDYYYWSGTFESAVNGVDASDAEIAVVVDDPNEINTYCSRSGTSISCLTAKTQSSASIVISGYYKNAGTSLWICPTNFDDLDGTEHNPTPEGATKSATISWNNSGNLNGVNLSIENQACSTP